MKTNDLISSVNTENELYRILSVTEAGFLVIDCIKKTMPVLWSVERISDYSVVEEVELYKRTHLLKNDLEDLPPVDRKTALERYTMIAGILPFLSDVQMRSLMIEKAADQWKVSKQTIRSFLCTYLVYQNVAALAPKPRKEKTDLTRDQKNMRWALNKFFYTRNQNSLHTAYIMMLKKKYCSADGQLLQEYPTFNQFRYFYRKHRNLEKEYIRRGGLKDYQKNHRPLLGDGVQQFAPTIGTAMLDGTICDIYLVNEKGQLVGRPVLVAACDTNTSLCLGYSLLWEGGIYSLQNLMLNILEDKVELCEKMGIHITAEQWAVNQLPRVMVTDGGLEYKGQTFEQIAELGVTLVNLPPYRPELKGTVEKLFDLIQNSYKDVLKGKGVIMPDFQERGAHDYRKDAVLTMKEFERIVVRCIIHYNCERVIQNYPYTAEMVEAGVKPYANTIWNLKRRETGAELIDITKKELVQTLLPRTTGKFTRYGLKVNHLRYYADGYKEQFLEGGECTVAYNPDNCSHVWLKEKDGRFVEFSLIEKRFEDMELDTVNEMQRKQKNLVQDTMKECYQAKIELMSFIEAVSTKEKKADGDQLKGSRAVRDSAKRSRHRDIGGVIYE